MGDEYNIQNVTEVLGIYPTETWNKGDKIRNSDQERSYTAWIYSTESIETLNISTLIEKIEQVFRPKIKEICQLKEKYDLDISLDFVIIIEHEEVPAIYFEPEFLEFVLE